MRHTSGAASLLAFVASVVACGGAQPGSPRVNEPVSSHEQATPTPTDPIAATCTAPVVRPLGFFLSDCRPSVAGRIDRILFNGNVEHSDAWLREKLLPLREGDRLADEALASAIKKLHFTHELDDVAVELVQRGPDAVEVTFLVTEIPVVDRIHVPHVEAAPGEVLETMEPALLTTNGRLDRERLDFALRRTKQIFESVGYFHAKLTAHVRATKPGHVEVCIQTHPGPKLAIRTIKINGAAAVSEPEWRSLLGATKPGQPYRPDELRDALVRISKLYAERGYGDADIQPPQISESAQAFDIDLRVDEGRRQPPR